MTVDENLRYFYHFVPAMGGFAALVDVLSEEIRCMPFPLKRSEVTRSRATRCGWVFLGVLGYLAPIGLIYGLYCVQAGKDSNPDTSGLLLLIAMVSTVAFWAQNTDFIKRQLSGKEDDDT